MQNNQNFNTLLAEIAQRGLHVCNLYERQDNHMWHCNLHLKFQRGTAVSPEWGSGATPTDAMERALAEAIKTFSLGVKQEVDPLS